MPPTTTSDLRILSTIFVCRSSRSCRDRLNGARSSGGLKFSRIQNASSIKNFSSGPLRKALRSPEDLPPRTGVKFKESNNAELLSLKWHKPPQNILLVRKEGAPEVTEALKEFANHIKSTYSAVNILLEPPLANELSPSLPFDIYNTTSSTHDSSFHSKVDLTTTFGGDGTILHASSIFSTSATVPPILSFSMGTLGFLGEWKFSEYKRAFREVYMSGSESERAPNLHHQTSPPSVDGTPAGPTGWSSIRGKTLGLSREARVLMRNRLKVSIVDPTSPTSGEAPAIHAMNEVLLHRGRDPHLTIIEIYIGGRFLTESLADGMIISTPTGSTAYSLSAGGSIIHPLVSSLLLTPICPRSLSFRPLVLPARTEVTLKLSEKNRGREVEVSIDGVRRKQGIGVGMELRVSGEEAWKEDGAWQGGIPCIMRRSNGSGGEGDDGWVGGLNGLLKFNYPFGDES